MAGAFVILPISNCKVNARLRQGSCKVGVIEYLTEQEAAKWKIIIKEF